MNQHKNSWISSQAVLLVTNVTIFSILCKNVPHSNKKHFSLSHWTQFLISCPLKRKDRQRGGKEKKPPWSQLRLDCWGTVSPESPCNDRSGPLSLSSAYIRQIHCLQNTEIQYENSRNTKSRVRCKYAAAGIRQQAPVPPFPYCLCLVIRKEMPSIDTISPFPLLGPLNWPHLQQ